MSDARLQQLEREVHTGGPAARVRYSRALRRAGREDEALAVLLRARLQADVRSEIGELPAWTHPAGNAGGTHRVDCRPVKTQPRVLWARRMRIEIDQLLFSPLGLAIRARNHSRWKTLLVDPNCGKLRREFRGRPLLIALDVVLVFRSDIRRLRAHDLWTGKHLYDTTLPGDVRAACWADGILALVNDGGVLAYSLSDPREVPQPAWVHGHPNHKGTDGTRPMALAAGTLVVGGPDGVVALDAQTGQVKWVREETCQQVCGDRAGFLLRSWGRLEEYSPAGELRWRASYGKKSMIATAGPHYLLLTSRTGPLLIDRTEGERIHVLPITGKWLAGGFARDDVGYFAFGPPFELVSGDFLTPVVNWSINLDHLGQPYQVAPAGRRVYGITTNRTVFAFQEAA